MKTCAVIPAYNESAVIGQVVRELSDKVDQIIVVDDGSADQTVSQAAAAGATVISHFLNRGQGAALQTGILFALAQQADIVVTFDADGQFLAEEVEAVVAPLLLGQVDVALGSRFLDRQKLTQGNLPDAKKLLLKAATLITRWYTGLAVTDTHNGFRALSRKAAQTIYIKHGGMAHASEIIEQIEKHQLSFTEVPVTVRYTPYSLKKGQKISRSFSILWDLLFSRLIK